MLANIIRTARSRRTFVALSTALPALLAVSALSGCTATPPNLSFNPTPIKFAGTKEKEEIEVTITNSGGGAVFEEPGGITIGSEAGGEGTEKYRWISGGGGGKRCSNTTVLGNGESCKLVVELVNHKAGNPTAKLVIKANTGGYKTEETIEK